MMRIFIPSPKIHKPHSSVCYSARDPVIVHKHFSCLVAMQPYFNDKGRLLYINFVKDNETIYRHLFDNDDLLIEGSPCGGVYNETLALSHIAQAYYRTGMRVPSSDNSVLLALESGACVYHGFRSFRAQKLEEHSQFVHIYFNTEGR